MPKFRCKYCHAIVPRNEQHVCEATGDVYDEEDFLEPVPSSAAAREQYRPDFGDVDMGDENFELPD